MLKSILFYFGYLNILIELIVWLTKWRRHLHKRKSGTLMLVVTRVDLIHSTNRSLVIVPFVPFVSSGTSGRYHRYSGTPRSGLPSWRPLVEVVVWQTPSVGSVSGPNPSDPPLFTCYSVWWCGVCGRTEVGSGSQVSVEGHYDQTVETSKISPLFVRYLDLVTIKIFYLVETSLTLFC